MNVDHVTGQVLSGPLAPAYVYEAPVRLAHWIMVICITGLAVTGYLIGAPLPSINGEATHHYLFGYIRMIHFIFGWVLGVTFLARVYWAIVGNHAARAIFVVPVWRGRWWRGLLSQVAYYLFLRKEPALWVGHNPLAQLAMFGMFTLGAIFMLVTGFALYAEQWGWGLWPMDLMGWVFVVGEQPQMVRTLHHLGMYYVLLFALVHVYMVFREDVMSPQSVVGTMISGLRLWKKDARV